MPVTTPWTLVDYANPGQPVVAWSSGNLGDTQPVIGNGQLHARWRLASGSYQFNLVLQVGSTTVLGTNAGGFGWQWNLPGTVGGPGVGGDNAAGYWSVSAGAVRNFGTGSVSFGACSGIVGAGSAISRGVQPLLYVSAGSVPADATHPWAWQAGDLLLVTGVIEGFDN